jgi:hypothetical protein
MPDDKSKTRPQDPTRVNVHEAYEVDYWYKRFGCSKSQLVFPVNAVGPMVTAVERCLKSRERSALVAPEWTRAVGPALCARTLHWFLQTVSRPGLDGQGSATAT